MKRYIIISAMLVLSLGLNAQTTNRGTRTTPTTTTDTKDRDNDRKSTPANSETHTREAAPVPAVTRTRESAPAVTETRTREAAPDRSENQVRESVPERNNFKTQTREDHPVRTAPAERAPQPVYNESRNRETPEVRPTTTTRTVQQPASGNSTTRTSGNTNSVTPRTTVQQPSRTDNFRNLEDSRNAGVYTNPTRESENRNSGAVRPTGSERPTGNGREDHIEKNRVYVPRTEQVYVEKRHAYRTPERPRTARVVNQQSHYVNYPVEYRKSYYPYAEPYHLEIIWDANMYYEYCYLYPQFDYWYYPYGYRIQTVSAYDAYQFIGEIARIYGKVSEVWYERQTDEYTLYIGGPYPYQDFSVIISGKHARGFSFRPDRYFRNRNIAVTGLVSLWDDRPEMLIKRRSQIEVYR
jgi:hypothetical protein